MLEKLVYISFILELMSDLFEVCDPQDDGMELYEMLYPSASCEKFVRESGLDEDDSETEDNFLDTDLDGNGRITHREMMKATMEPYGLHNINCGQ